MNMTTVATIGKQRTKCRILQFFDTFLYNTCPTSVRMSVENGYTQIEVRQM
jgi:hypothetical protein